MTPASWTPATVSPVVAGTTPPSGRERGLENRADEKSRPDGAPRQSGHEPKDLTPETKAWLGKALQPPKVTENQFLADVRKQAIAAGWEPYHTHNSQRSEPGWPDLVLASAKQRRVLFIELKTDTGRVSKAQQKWLDLLLACGQEAAVWRPADWPAIMRILRGERIGGAS